ncbi:DUF3182 family protein [Noviherbaspirillum cavernae]|uniref:DUF3182 family protein n=2 Tax=Noviherbaspirillum cavernae TaxID=2320862 RepID=A0A418WWC7_9BURK|nr:DUF3182 family protein [Noviherbaspirillum cavernae]
MAGPSDIGRGTVVLWPDRLHGDPLGHEHVTHDALARRLAALKGCEFGGCFDAACRYDGPLYFVPGDTLSSIDHAQGLGIRDEQDLFGGVVPFPFAATKVITHPLVHAEAAAPCGWPCDFSRCTGDAVLHGFSAFTPQDARSAGLRLLTLGSVRIKKPRGVGGSGQSLAVDADQLEAQLDAIDDDDLQRCGLVLEQNLSNVTTRSVGQVRVGPLLATYCGVQRLTVGNDGRQAYGGSDLLVVRGGFDALLALGLAGEVTLAIMQARAYHAAAMQSFPGMFASRCNYDVAQGIDDAGRWRSGVLEQSWRIGGASGAEVAALEAFCDDPALAAVRASTTEIHGDNPVVPDDAIVYYRGVDADIGALVKYSTLKPHAAER